MTLSDCEWSEKISRASELTSPCILCERRCKALRLKSPSDNGFCQMSSISKISGFGPHFGEESPLVGMNGSGTVFFSSCNLKCDFCQNYEIAHLNKGHVVSDLQLASIFLSLQNEGCHNINLVTPTHFVFNILKAIRAAVNRGLEIPIVYNTGGYDSIETLQVLNNVVDIYLPDMKFGKSDDASEFLHISDYTQANFSAVKEMHRQVGDLVIENKIAKRGLLVRHLVLPENKAGTEKVMEFISEKISKNTYVNIMDQYRPHFKVLNHSVLGRQITKEEYNLALDIAKKAGLKRAGVF